MKYIAVWIDHKEVPYFRFQERHRRRLEQGIPEAAIHVCPDQERFLQVLPQADTALVWRFKEEWLERATNLRRIILPTAGRDFIQFQLPGGISLEVSSFHGQIMVETVLGMILAHARGILKSYALQQQGLAWPRAELYPHQRRLAGSLVTILGFGHIGDWIARQAKPLGVRLCGIKRRVGPIPDYFQPEDRILPINQLEAVLPETDHLVLCLPRSPDTDRIMDARRLGLLPPQAGLYNVGRGNAVDEQALAELLQSRELSAAYLDVFQQEPLPPDSPLRKCPNCYIMPHASSFSPDFLDLFVEELIQRQSSWR